MNNQVAINFLDQVRKILLDDKSWLESTEQQINEALDMAISALQAQELSETQKALDTISRQAAIDDLHGKDPSQVWDTADIEVWIDALPPAQPEPCKSDEAAKRLNDLIFDINPWEICSQIESDNLSDWCKTIQTEMKMAMVQLPCWGGEKMAATGYIKALPSVTPKRKTMICGACSHSDSETLYATNPPRIQCRKTGNLHFATDVCDCENMNNQHEISHSDEDAVSRKRLKRQ